MGTQAWKSEAAPEGAKASVNMAAQRQPGADLMETAASGRTLSQPPSGQAALSSRGAGPSVSPSRSAPPHPGRPGPRATRCLPRAARPARDAAALPEGRPPHRRPAHPTLACSRAGAQARQVQVPLRCAEGTYSWCSRLLAVSHTRKWPSLEAKAKYA